MPTDAYEDAYVDVYEVCEPYADNLHRWRRRGRQASWALTIAGVLDGLILPWFHPPWQVFLGVVVLMTGIIGYGHYCDRQRKKADKLMMAKFHEVFKAQLQLHGHNEKNYRSNRTR